jgi:hypothetical protein
MSTTETHTADDGEPVVILPDRRRNIRIPLTPQLKNYAAFIGADPATVAAELVAAGLSYKQATLTGRAVF